MNKISIALLVGLCLFFTACDGNKGKIEEKAKQFTEAVKGNDVATIYDMYPNAKLVNDMKLPKSIAMADIEVVKDTASGNYTATIKNAREQKLVFKVVGEDAYQIIDSYGLFDIEADYSDLAVKAGVPLKQLSDQTLNKLFMEGSDFMTFINNKFKDITGLYISAYDGVYNRQYTWVECTQNIKNDGKFLVKGSDYDVVFHFTDTSGHCAYSTKTMDGVDLEPGESFTYTFQLDGYATSAYYHALTWVVSFTQKGGKSLKDILKKGKFSGTEYAEYMKQAKNKKNNKKK